MKKSRIFAAMTAFCLFFSGCANTDIPQSTESTVQETTVAEIAHNTEPEENTPVFVSESETHTEESAPVTTTEPPKAESSPPVTEKITETPAPVSPPEKETERTETAPPKATTPAKEEPKHELPQETQPPTEKPTMESFNIQTWIDFAVGYAKSVGLNVSPDATACWDNPITTGAHSTCLERDIESRLNRYSRDEDITDVWIWTEQRSDGSYDLFIGYA